MPTLTLTPEQFQRITRAIADPNRYLLLRRIHSAGEICCGEVASELSITAGTASHHLRELENADLIRVSKEGRYRKLAPRRDIWRAFVAQLRTLAL